MTRDITPIKWLIGAIALLIIVAGACYLWYQHSLADERKAAAEATELARQWELTQKADTESGVEQAADVISAQGTMPTTEKPRTKRGEPAVTKDNAPVETQNVAAGMPSVENTKPVRVSPHGFGPYPKIPEGAPIAEFHESDDVGMELLLRTAVKAWNEGERFLGASGDEEKVYLHYPNTLYVWYTTVDNGDGTFSKRISRGKSGGDVNITEEQVRTGNLPPGLRIIEMDKAGIEPYSYLGLR
ncbi:MAG: hypothetical protein OXI67_21725 [Candidatus Poribacteria bacterium]|nr:hypothetical protein [Candidatus Poribacteria bacterium]